jgi:hypothetical protein
MVYLFSYFGRASERERIETAQNSAQKNCAQTRNRRKNIVQQKQKFNYFHSPI